MPSSLSKEYNSLKCVCFEEERVMDIFPYEA